ncbi:MAG: RNA polymerase sigma-70 factor [Bacteroidales bacterium]
MGSIGKMNNRSDQTLLKRIKQHDQEALEQLFEKYYFPLCDFAFQFVRSFDFTEEVVSDVFMNIWKNRQKIQISSSLKAYLFTATRNQSLNYLKKEKMDFETLDVLENEESHTYQPDEELMFRELESRIKSLINTLPPKRKLIFKLSRLEGFTYREIADILDISIRTVQNQMVQAVKQLASYSKINNN